MAAFSLLDIFFPKRCVSCGRVGNYICDDCYSQIDFIDETICPVCREVTEKGKTHKRCVGSSELDGLIVVCKYRGVVGKAIRSIKYRWSWDISKVLTDLVASNLEGFDFPKDSILVPVPLHLKRKRWRGFNQAEILAKNLSKKTRLGFKDLAERTIYTKPQVELSKQERIINIDGAFKVKSIDQVKDKDFIVVDDVFTSGATMMEVGKTLKKAGARSVWGMAVALG